VGNGRAPNKDTTSSLLIRQKARQSVNLPHRHENIIRAAQDFANWISGPRLNCRFSMGGSRKVVADSPGSTFLLPISSLQRGKVAFGLRELVGHLLLHRHDGQDTALVAARAVYGRIKRKKAALVIYPQFEARKSLRRS